jgi:hypothetical protein
MNHGASMNKPKQLQDLGQSPWLDNIPAETLSDAILRRHIDELSGTGLTSDPVLSRRRGEMSSAEGYDDGLREKAKVGKSGESVVRGAGAGRPGGD